MIGRSIGHYEITGKLGEGMMGEVYRATDTRLKRDVAIKMLPPGVSADPDRVARMRREAEVLASLNHSNIAQIYGLEPTDESLALVLELVEGATLEDRLQKGPLPLDRALGVAHQIAAALETAHEGGIIHRDLKPANVKRTPEGDVKVLDFGLAKGVRLDQASTELTADGAVIGTPAYMSPEQVEGRPLDRRTDIWSFGCVFFEMLTGTRAFGGDSVGSLFVAIATAKPDLERIADAPPRVRRLIERCLRKDAKTRLRDIGDARVELEEIIAGKGEDEPVTVTPSRPRYAVAALLAVVALLMGGLLGALAPGDDAPVSKLEPAPVQRFSIAIPGAPARLHLDAPSGYSPPLAVSRDGRRFAFSALDSKGKRRVYLRTADNPACVPLENTDGAESVFFSPDGEELGFSRIGGEDLRRISLLDGTVNLIADTWSYRGATWLADNTIVYAPVGKGLYRIARSGGEPEKLTELGESEIDHRWPQVLPDNRHLLFTAAVDQRLEPRILDLTTGRVVPIDVQGSFARFVAGGYLLYMKTNTLWAIRIDIESGKTTGKRVPVASGIHESSLGIPYLAVSTAGVLVYEPMRPPSPGQGLVWVDRKGTTKTLDTGKGYEFPRISPDGRSVVFANHKPSSVHDVWILDVEQGGTTPIASDGNFVSPNWAPEGNVLVFSEFVGMNLYTRRLSESASQPLLQRIGKQWPLQWLKSGRILMQQQLSGRTWDLMELDPGDLTLHPVIASGNSESAGTVSADGRWIAYVSDQSGQSEIYVQLYPAGPKIRISESGGKEPRWSPTDRELFFRRGNGLYAVDVPRNDEAHFGKPKLLFEGQFVEGFSTVANYDVSADGKHFVMVDGGVGLTAGRLDVHLHFVRELEQAFSSSR